MLPRPEIARTTSFRLALLYAGLFAASTLVLFAIIYQVSTGTLAEQIDAALADERTALIGAVGSGGTTDLVTAINEHMNRPGARFRYVLQDALGAVLAGGFPPQEGRREQYFTVELPPGHIAGTDPNFELHEFRVLREHLSNGTTLLIAEDAFVIEELRELIIRGFVGGGGAALLLAAIGGALMSAGALRRVEAINRASESIIAGDLSRRLPVRTDHSAGDEFDRLAVNLNVMLDRIEKLVIGLRQVSTDIAHDLRAPLGRLQRTLESARNMASVSEGSHLAAIDRAIVDTNTILTTFGALLRIAQIEAGAAKRGFGILDVSSVLESVIEVYSSAAEEKGQSLTGRIPVGHFVMGDRALLTQLFANVVENAVRHAGDNARIAVELVPATSERGIEVTVSDDGPGIPVAQWNNVFRRFYRLDASRSTPGSGLGLSLVAAIADLHGIVIRLADHKPQGLEVYLSFPAETATGRKHRDPSPEASLA